MSDTHTSHTDETTDVARQDETLRREAARSFARFLQILEDGQLHEDLSAETQKMAETLNQHVQDFGGSPKGTLTITMDFKLKEGVFDISTKFKSKYPEQPRPRTIMWSDDGNRFVPENPRQSDMFGGGIRTINPGTKQKQL